MNWFTSRTPKIGQLFILITSYVYWNVLFIFGPFFGVTSIEVIIEDDSPKTSIKSQAMNGGNNGSTTTTKPNEPSSTTTGDSVHTFAFYLYDNMSITVKQLKLKIMNWVNCDVKFGFSAIFFRWIWR